MPCPPRSRSAPRFVKIALLVFLAVAIYLQLDLGMADQGDFLRASAWFTAGPVGLDAVVAVGSPDYAQRYFQWYLPYWRCHPDGIRHCLHSDDWGRTSTSLLWLPGVLANYLLHSDCVFYLPIVSLLPRLLLFGVCSPPSPGSTRVALRHELALYLIIGVPLAFLLSTTDYLAYLNSLYQETGSMIYLGFWIAALLYLKQRPQSLPRGLLGVALLTLLCRARASNVYWVLLGLPFLALVWRPWQATRWRMLRLAALYAALTCGMLAAYLLFACRPDNGVHPYNALFDGILTFSKNPSARLAELGLADSTSCVDTHAFSAQGQTIPGVQRPPSHISRHPARRPSRAQCHAPHAEVRRREHARHLGGRTRKTHRLRSPALPRPTAPCNISEQRWWDARATTPLNLWSFLKYHAFPAGRALIWTLGVYAAVFLALLRTKGFAAELALVGLMTTLACAVDACVAICGDGQVRPDQTPLSRQSAFRRCLHRPSRDPLARPAPLLGQMAK